MRVLKRKLDVLVFTALLNNNVLKLFYGLDHSSGRILCIVQSKRLQESTEISCLCQNHLIIFLLQLDAQKETRRTQLFQFE